MLEARFLAKAFVWVLLFTFICTTDRVIADTFEDYFTGFSGWTYVPGSTGTFKSDGQSLVVDTFGSQNGAKATYELPFAISTSSDFSARLHVRVTTDPNGGVGGFGLQLLDPSGQIAGQLAWHDVQASSGFGGIDLWAEGGGQNNANPIYRSDPSGFSREYPTIDSSLEIQRTGNDWSAWVGGTEKGSIHLSPTKSITKIELYSGSSPGWTPRDIHVDYVSVDTTGHTPTSPPANLVPFFEKVATAVFSKLTNIDIPDPEKCLVISYMAMPQFTRDFVRFADPASQDDIYSLLDKIDINTGRYIAAMCPVDLVLTDSIGRKISKDLNEIPGAQYFADLPMSTGDLGALITLPEGDSLGAPYTVSVIGRNGTGPNDTYSLIGAGQDYGGMSIFAANAPIPTQPLTFTWVQIPEPSTLVIAVTCVSFLMTRRRGR